MLTEYPRRIKSVDFFSVRIYRMCTVRCVLQQGFVTVCYSLQVSSSPLAAAAAADCVARRSVILHLVGKHLSKTFSQLDYTCDGHTADLCQYLLNAAAAGCGPRHELSVRIGGPFPTAHRSQPHIPSPSPPSYPSPPIFPFPSPLFPLLPSPSTARIGPLKTS